MTRRVAVVGAGWAGLSCAVQLVEAGWEVTLFEANTVAGGRARSVATSMGVIDNGQHLLIGPYHATFAMMHKLGVDRRQVLRRLPLSLHSTDGLRLNVPGWPLGLGRLAALVGARGLGPGGRRALLRVALDVPAARHATDRSVAVWLQTLNQPAALVRRLWAPLCVAALNTPADRASARVFAHVLHDGLLAAGRDASLELPSRPLGALLPDPALAWLRARGARVYLGHRVRHLLRCDQGWRVDCARETSAAVNHDPPLERSPSTLPTSGSATAAASFDTLVVATAPAAAARLLRDHADDRTLAALAGLEPLAIATLHLRLDTTGPVTAPLQLLDDGPGEWLIDHGDGRLSIVISAYQRLADPVAQISRQLQRNVPKLPRIAASQWIVEKRATFACTPNLHRPSHQTGADQLWLAGDYTPGPYPATLEAAVRSGVECARLITGHAP